MEKLLLGLTAEAMYALAFDSIGEEYLKAKSKLNESIILLSPIIRDYLINLAKGQEELNLLQKWITCKANNGKIIEKEKIKDKYEEELKEQISLIKKPRFIVYLADENKPQGNEIRQVELNNLNDELDKDKLSKYISRPVTFRVNEGQNLNEFFEWLQYCTQDAKEIIINDRYIFDQNNYILNDYYKCFPKDVDIKIFYLKKKYKDIEYINKAKGLKHVHLEACEKDSTLHERIILIKCGEDEYYCIGIDPGLQFIGSGTNANEHTTITFRKVNGVDYQELLK